MCTSTTHRFPATCSITISDDGQRRGRKMWYPFAPGQVQVQKSCCHHEDLVQTLDDLCPSWCNGWRESVSLPVVLIVLWRTVPLVPLPHQSKTQLSSCMRYQNDRQGALSQIVSIRRLLVPCVDCRLGWRVRLGSCRECILAAERSAHPS